MSYVDASLPKNATTATASAVAGTKGGIMSERSQKKEPHASVGRGRRFLGWPIREFEREGRKEPFKGANNIQQQPEINHAMSFRPHTLRVREGGRDCALTSVMRRGRSGNPLAQQ